MTSKNKSTLSPFEYIDAVSHSKKNMMEGTDNDALAEKEYNAWLTNKMLSYHKDCILHVNEMNRLWELPNKAQFFYYINSLRPRKRFAKLTKMDNSETIGMVMKEYSCSRRKAIEYMSLLSTDQIAMIEEKYNKRGEVTNDGKTNRKSGRSKTKK